MDEKKSVIIIGGGISGLVSAYVCLQKGQDVTIFEKDNRLGGLIGSNQTPFGIVEQAANGFLNSYYTEKLTNDLGLKLIKPNSSARKRYFFRNNYLVQFPIASFYILRALFGLFFLNSKPKEFESMDEWCSRIFGSKFTHFVAEPALGGIYSTELKKMHVHMVLSNFVFNENYSLFRNVLYNKKLKEQKEGKIPKPRFKKLVGFENGMQELIDALYSRIKEKASIHFNSNISSIQELLDKHPNSEIRICTSTSETLKLIQNWDLGKNKLNSNNFENLDFQSIATITRFGNTTVFYRPGFGILFPGNEGVVAKGVLANHIIFPGRVKDIPYSETWIYSGEIVDNLDKQELIQYVDRDCKTIDPEMNTENSKYFPTIWRKAFPIYNLNLLKFNQILDEIESFCKDQSIKIHFLGNYRRGIGLRSLIENAMKI